MKVAKNIKYKKYLFLCLSFLQPSICLAQNVGVGTRNPTSTNSLEVVTTAGNVIVDNTGKMGVIVPNPTVALDLRSGANQSIAVGMTTQTAAQAGAGALRYNPTPAIGVNGYLEYSDGTKWIGYFPYGKPRIVVMAEKTSQNVYAFEPGAVAVGALTNGMPQRTSSYLTNWTEKLDSDSGSPTNNFDPSTGEFIAPRDGVYFATFTFALQANYIKSWIPSGNANQTEAIWEVRSSAGVIKQRVKTANGYPSDTGSGYNTSGGILISGSICTVSVYMIKGDKLRPFSWISLSDAETNYSTSARPFDVSGGYNVLTIVEQ